MDVSTITDVTQLKVMLADEYTKREQAAAVHQQASNNISILQQRIGELSQQQAEMLPPEAHQVKHGK